MEYAAGPRRTARNIQKVDYRISSSSSSSSDDPIQPPNTSPSQFVKRESSEGNSLAQLSPESFQKQDLSELDDAPLVPHHLRIAATGKEETIIHITLRPESKVSSGSLRSDIPLFPYIERSKRKSREFSNRSSGSLLSDEPLFPYVQKILRSAGAALNFSLPPLGVPWISYLGRQYLKDSEVESHCEDHALQQDTYLTPGRTDLAESVKVEVRAPDGLFSNVPLVHDQNLLNLTKLSPLARITTPQPLGSRSININQKGGMAPGVSDTLKTCETSQLNCKCSIETGIGTEIALATSITMFLRDSLFGIGAATMLL
jgi:hypothetical protein